MKRPVKYPVIRIENEEIKNTRIILKEDDLIVFGALSPILSIRCAGELAGRGYVLDSEYHDWIIAKDLSGVLMLIPIKK